MIALLIVAALLAVGAWFWIYFDVSWVSYRYGEGLNVVKKRIGKAEAAWTASWIVGASALFGTLVYLAVGLA